VAVENSAPWSGDDAYPATHPMLAEGAQIAVVGGGPAGSFFSIHLLEAARRAGRQLAVTIYEPKSFAVQGPGGCNKSAGILSPPLLANLQRSGLILPPQVQMGHIERFILHLRGQISCVPSSGPQLPVTTYRGSGPLRADMQDSISFDGWLLAEALSRGATLVSEPVIQVTLAPTRPQVQTPAGSHAADLVVLATGVNSSPPALIGVDYQPPRTETMAQGELLWTHPPPGGGPGTTHVFLDGLPGLFFAAFVPKGPYVSLSILGEHLPTGSVRRFLARPELAACSQLRLCGCRPQIAVGPAQQFFADRFVAVGDAAVTRLYKDGIGSAFLTARAAAHTALLRGVAAEDFAIGYAPTCQALYQDNRFARWLFDLWLGLQRSPRLGRALFRALDGEAGLPATRWHWRWAVWAILTGGASYRAACRKLLNPRAIVRFIQALS
jgi:flavin-dependent dehydrogenase